MGEHHGFSNTRSPLPTLGLRVRSAPESPAAVARSLGRGAGGQAPGSRYSIARDQQNVPGTKHLGSDNLLGDDITDLYHENIWD